MLSLKERRISTTGSFPIRWILLIRMVGYEEIIALKEDAGRPEDTWEE